MERLGTHALVCVRDGEVVYTCTGVCQVWRGWVHMHWCVSGMERLGTHALVCVRDGEVGYTCTGVCQGWRGWVHMHWCVSGMERLGTHALVCVRDGEVGAHALVCVRDGEVGYTCTGVCQGWRGWVHMHWMRTTVNKLIHMLVQIQGERTSEELRRL